MPAGQQYGTNVPQTNIPVGVTAASTAWAVASSTGWPTTPFTAVLDIGTSIQEPVDVGSVSGVNWSSITRAIDSTTAFAHGPACTVTFGVTGRDFRESRSHIDASTNVHGLTGGAAVVGDTQSQTLTNKIMTAPILNTPSLTQATASGAANQTPMLVQGAAAQSVDIFEVTSFGEANGPVLKVDSLGRAVAVAPAAAQPAFTTIGNTNQTGDLFTSQDVSNTKVFRVLANGATGAGATQIQPTDTGLPSLLVNSPNGITADAFEVGINSAKMLSVSSGGNTVINNLKQLDLTNANATAPVLGPAWQTYTPTWAGGTVAIGNGTLTGYYQQVGKLTHFRIRLTAGTTTNFGGATSWSFALPVAARTTSANETMGMATGLANHAGVSVILVTGAILSGVTVLGGGAAAVNGLYTPSNTGTAINSTTPFAWASTDNLFLSGFYESA